MVRFGRHFLDFSETEKNSSALLHKCNAERKTLLSDSIEVNETLTTLREDGLAIGPKLSIDKYRLPEGADRRHSEGKVTSQFVRIFAQLQNRQAAGIKLHLNERYFLDLAAPGLRRRDQQRL
jgi:hypothetical protein